MSKRIGIVNPSSEAFSYKRAVAAGAAASIDRGTPTKEDTTEVLNKDFSIEYRTGETPSQKTAKVIEEMQIEINNYKSAKVIFDSTALNNAVTTINGGLIC